MKFNKTTKVPGNEIEAFGELVHQTFADVIRRKFEIC